jgi:hypothetical protein
MHLWKTLEQVGQFVARRFFVVNNQGINWHKDMNSSKGVYVTGSVRSTGGIIHPRLPV